MSKTNPDHAPYPSGSPSHPNESAEQRRLFLGASIGSVILGGLLNIAPFIPGLGLFLDPLLRQRKQAIEGDDGNLIRVGHVQAVPDDGTPVQVPVMADLTDAWNREPNQPIGSVYLQKLADGKIRCFNSICPHAGCKVSYAEDRDVYQCPCHTSTFLLDGKRVEPSPSPRGMDELEVKVDNGDIRVRFVNYLTGTADQIAK